MSKLLVIGNAKMDFTADVFIISIKICAKGVSSGEAISSGKEKTEQFLTLMQNEMNIAPSDFMLEADLVDEDYHDKGSYIYTKKLSLEITSNLSALSRITSLFKELTGVQYSVDFDFSDKTEKENQVIDAAVKDSRMKAEMIASSLGKTIQGIDDISFERPFSYRFADTSGIAKSITVGDCDDLEAMLKKPTKNISKEIFINWIIE